MRRILAAILSTAIALQPLAAANATPYVRFMPSGSSAATSSSSGGSDTTSPAVPGITGPSPLYAHVYSLTDATYALASGKAATFSASGLPAGLNMAADGTLSGTPSDEASGTAIVTALLADGFTQVLSVPYEVHGLLSANYPVAADGTVGDAGHVNVPLAVAAPALTGGPVLPVTWAVTQGGALPAGVALNADGTVSGTPTVPGDFVFALLATDASGATALTQSYDMSVADGIHVAALPDVSGHVGFPLVAETGSATGTIVGPLTWSVVGGPLPQGVSLDKGTGTISGTPTAAEKTTSAMLSAVDSTGIPGYSAPFQVTAYGALAIGTVPDMAMHVGQSFTSAAFVPENAPVKPWSWLLTSGATLPFGLSIDANAGDVYGAGNAVGSSTVTVDIVDHQGDSATSNPFAVSVVAPLALAAIADASAPSGGSVTVTPTLSGTPVGTLRWDLTGYGYGVSTTQDPATGAVTFSSTSGSTGNYRLTASDDSGTLRRRGARLRQSDLRRLLRRTLHRSGALGRHLPRGRLGHPRRAHGRRQPRRAERRRQALVRDVEGRGRHAAGRADARVRDGRGFRNDQVRRAIRDADPHRHRSDGRGRRGLAARHARRPRTPRLHARRGVGASRPSARGDGDHADADGRRRHGHAHLEPAVRNPARGHVGGPEHGRHRRHPDLDGGRHG